MDRYAGDPHWIAVRHDDRCRACGRAIRRGERAFYYPRGKHVYCDGPCGATAAADFESAAFDESVANGAW